ncbi:hypothetical protein L6452_00703 [Arctium lappa]|uniref:Uncharacterized protein n=1 Tax=Arctium lappa TaxID=4217 RepID=A0ACB9FES5_ARCLA|nr:hypothetical protein L6452_00703 [Arctium lappa]
MPEPIIRSFGILKKCAAKAYPAYPAYPQEHFPAPATTIPTLATGPALAYPPSHRAQNKFDRRYSTIVDSYNSLEQSNEWTTGEVEDAKYGRDDRGYYNGGGRGGYYNGGGRGGYHNGGGRGGYYNGGGHGGYNHGGGRGGGYCRYGCCGGGRYYNGGCRCCSTAAEATVYEQAHQIDRSRHRYNRAILLLLRSASIYMQPKHSCLCAI